ncbi:hypothetical protein Syun_010257 [Stephania yunnanensis]|uniref:Uncharacterized protein n=1 Tax=Stephania yunnanensis TaxID=152371 RepID=A0AAP0KG52_9MAGN
MSVEASIPSFSPRPLDHTKPVDHTVRKSANYHPSIWGDYFVEYTSNVEVIYDSKQEVEKQEAKVKELLKATKNDPLEQLNLINALQRLGVGYRFTIEIEQALKEIHDSTPDFINNDHDLYAAALYFRLLRQQGYKVSCDVFYKFKDNDNGDFKSDLRDDVKGMLSLYEACHLKVHGEDILEEALNFTTTHLKSALMTNFGSSNLGNQVQYALEHPLHKGMPRLEARNYISLYHEECKWSNVLKKLAVLDFNLVQSFHKKELSDVSKWWKDLDFASKLPFARDRLVEGYFWTVGAYFEPSYSLARMFMTKVIALTSTIDDIYDVYGTLAELELFTDAIEKWDDSAMTKLPEYMKVCYKALLDVYEETEEVLRKEGRSYHVYYAKQAMKEVVQAYFVEAKWCNEGYVPKMEEYMRIAVVTSGYYMLTATSFVEMGKIVSKEAFDWVNNSKLVLASCIIARIMDDLVSHEREQKRGHVASALECYMKQHGVSEQAVHDEFDKMLDSAWKDLNEGCLSTTTTTTTTTTNNNNNSGTVIPMALRIRAVNLARMIYVIYKDEDAYTHSSRKLKECIAVLFIKPLLHHW